MLQMQATNSYLPGSQKTVKWAPEMLMLFWEALQCNKRFRSFIIDSKRSHDFIILCLFYAIEYKSDSSKQGMVRMCIFILQTMSVEPNFGRSLNTKFEAQDTLPPIIRIPGFRGSYADYLLMVCPFSTSTWTALITLVCSYSDYRKQRQPECRLPSTARNHQQHRGIRGESVASGLLEAIAALLVDVCA